MKSTLTEFNKKAWYRFIKVIYILLFLIILGIGSLLILGDNYVSEYEILEKMQVEYPNTSDSIEIARERGVYSSEILKEIILQNPPFPIEDFQSEIRLVRKSKNMGIFLVAIIFFFELGRRLFYYIALGSFKPKK